MIPLNQTEEQARVERLIERAAERIARYRLQSPAVLFLEMHRPLAGVASQLVHFASPFFAPFLGLERVEDLALLLSKGEYVDRLIDRIEGTQGQAHRETQDGAL